MIAPVPGHYPMAGQLSQLERLGSRRRSGTRRATIDAALEAAVGRELAERGRRGTRLTLVQPSPASEGYLPLRSISSMR